MQKFRFRLDSLMRMREARENEALIALADTQRAFQREVDLKKQLRDEIEESLNKLAEIGKKPLSVHELQVEETFIKGNRSRIVAADQRIERTRKSVVKAMRDYMLARRERMSLGKLKDKALADWKKARDARERKQIEDLILIRANGRYEEESA